MNVLVLAAHPDDEVLGCGGTMARLVSEGHAVYVVILGEGAASRHIERTEALALEQDRLHVDAQAANAVLGCKEVVVEDLPDNRFDTVPLLEIVRRVEGHIARVEPELIYTHHGGDLNIDHALVHRATLTATRPTPGTGVREVRAYEVPSSTEWTFGRLDSPFQPNLFVDIHETLALKQRAMAIYEGEARAFPHPRSPQALEAIARRWGSVAGLKAAEAFELVRRME